MLKYECSEHQTKVAAPFTKQGSSFLWSTSAQAHANVCHVFETEIIYARKHE